MTQQTIREDDVASNEAVGTSARQHADRLAPRTRRAPRPRGALGPRWLAVRSRWHGVRSGWRGVADDAGMATAEYAVVTLAAVGFAGLLLVILKSSEVRDLLLGIIRAALSS